MPSSRVARAPLAAIALIALVFSPTAIAAGPCAGGTNLLVNCSFDSNFGSWGTNGGIGNVTWVSTPDNSGGGGSIQLISDPGGNRTLYQCFLVSPSTSYGFGTFVFQTPDACTAPQVGIRVLFYQQPTADCATLNSSGTLSAITPFVDGPVSTTTSSWVKINSTASTPSDTNSIFFVMASYCSNSLVQAGTSYVDEAFFGQGLTPVDLRSFSAD